MPPKARGKGTARGRGRGRGGASTTRQTAGASESKEPELQQVEAPPSANEALAEPEIAKAEESDEKAPAAEGNATVTSASQTPSSATASVSEPPQDGPESSSRPPFQRIGSLQGSVPPSIAGSSAGRGRGGVARGKRGMARPTFTGRRSKEEREALAKEQREKDSMRNAERDAAIRKREQDEAHKAKREAKHALRARGGYSGAMSGPFSMGSSREDKKTNFRSGTNSLAGSRSGSRASRVKNEGESSTGTSHAAGGSGSSTKKDDGMYISSDDEDDAEFPRKNIDFIELSDGDDPQQAVPKPRLLKPALPVRIGRKEHKERTFGINTEASSEITAKVEQADTTSQPSAAASSQQALRKGKGKAKDVEITSARKPFRGVWQDAEDAQNSSKNEAMTDDENMVDVRQLSAIDAPTHATKKADTISPHSSERAPKARIKNIPMPVLQTDEDRAEWERYQTNLRHIRRELGPEKIPAVDVAGDTVMGDDAASEVKGTLRDNCVYLFQIPPLMPELLVTGIKKEPELPSGGLATVQTQSIKPEAKIKVEEGNFSDPAVRSPHGPRFASGLIGKLRVRQSGRTTLDWGGTSYEITTAGQASFLQDVVSVKVVPEKDRIVPEDAGEAVSLGRVKGKFIVIPDWESVLG